MAKIKQPGKIPAPAGSAAALYAKTYPQDEEDDLDEETPVPAGTKAKLPAAAPAPAAGAPGPAQAAVQKAQALGLEPDADSSEAPTSDEFQTVLDRIKAARSAATTPVDLEKFTRAEDEARQLYQDRAERSEWLSLADRIGTALTRYGAARAGMNTGVDMSGINYGPGYDADKASDRAARDYSMELERIGRQRGSALKQQGEEFGLGEKALESLNREKSLEASDRRAAANQASTDRRQANSLTQQAKLAGDREQKDRDFRKQMNEEADKKADIKDLEGQQKAADKQYQAKKQLFNQMLTDSDLGRKDREKLQAQYGKLAAEADVDLDDIKRRLGAEETRPRILGGRSGEEDVKAKKTILSAELLKSKNLLDQIVESKKKRLGNQAASESAPPPAGGTVKVKGPSGQVATMTKENAQKYLSKPGYSIVP